MADGDATIARYLFEDGRCQLGSAADSRPLTDLKAELRRHAPWLPWATAQQEVEKKIAEALDVDVGDLLLSSWLRSALLVKYLDSSRYPPSQPILAHLSEHTVKTSLQPTIGVYAGNVLVSSIKLDVSLSLTLKGFILTIKGGRVLQMKTGTCDAKVQMASTGVVLVQKGPKTIELPGTIVFGNGRPIPAAAT